MNLSITKILSYTIVVVVIAACGVKKAAEKHEKLPRVKTNVLVDRLDSLSSSKPEHFYTKISTSYRSDIASYNFKTSLRIRKDSAVNAFVTYANFLIATTMITPDTLTIVNRRQKCYIKENMEYLKRNFGVDFEQENLEELLLGMPVDWDKNDKYFQINNPYNYVISSHRKRQLKKADKKEDYDDIILLYYFDRTAKNLEKVIIESPIDSTQINIHYKERRLVDNVSVPELINVDIYTPRDTIGIEMEYNKTKVNQRKKLYLAIPDDYEECQ